MRQLLEDRQIKLLGPFFDIPNWFSSEVLKYITEEHRRKPRKCSRSTPTGQMLIEYLKSKYQGGRNNSQNLPYSKHFNLWLYLILFSSHSGADTLREALNEPRGKCNDTKLEKYWNKVHTFCSGISSLYRKASNSIHNPLFSYDKERLFYLLKKGNIFAGDREKWALQIIYDMNL